jgi:uncharacterized protein (TIGR02466 family)
MVDLFRDAEVFVPDSFRVGGLFPTPLVVAVLCGADALNTELTTTILDRSQRERGTQLSNVGGWHSSDLLCWSGAAGGTVIDAARVMVDRMTLMDSPDGPVPARVSWRVTAWANINRSGHSNRPHGHPGAFWSGIYWVDDGDADQNDAVGGLLEFADPRGILPAMNAPQLHCAVEDCMSAGRCQTVTPKSGTMVLFPSWLIHSVTTYCGERPRISIAFNFSL